MTGDDDFVQPRRFRVFAFDPSTARDFTNRELRFVTISLPSEMDPDLGIGPRGEYLEVVDYDPSARAFYLPLDPNAEEVRLNDGLRPSAEDPRFHQQMVYAVAMNTIAIFEEALGRRILWAPRSRKTEQGWREDYVQRLRIYPHALREANAFYDPERKALLFGYFQAGANRAGAPPGTAVFTCLSHDIAVHETVHAILDGLHPRFAEDSNPDMRALHEAFADLVAILQLFSYPEVLQSQIAATRGNLEDQSLLGQLAQEFGLSLGRSGALRSALGEVRDGKWIRTEPDRARLSRTEGAHDRGAILVAAVFGAFLKIYKARVADLFRIASSGSGVLREGEIDPDLCRRLAREAAHSASRALRICVRAMDYVPPVSVSFGDYLRAVITADSDLYPDDEIGYRDAFVDSFAEWGIVPERMQVMTQATLLWPSLADVNRDLGGKIDLERLGGELGAAISRPGRVLEELEDERPDWFGARRNEHAAIHLRALGEDSARLAAKVEDRVGALDRKRRLEADGPEQKPVHRSLKHPDLKVGELNMLALGEHADREAEFHARYFYARLVWMLIMSRITPELTRALCLSFDDDLPLSVPRSRITGRPSLHVLPVRQARRVGKMGSLEREYVIELEQSRYGWFDRELQMAADRDGEFDRHAHPSDFTYRAGCTLLVDTRSFAIRRLIRTAQPVGSQEGFDRLRAHLLRSRSASVTAFSEGGFGAEAAFADLHRRTRLAKGGFR